MTPEQEREDFEAWLGTLTLDEKEDLCVYSARRGYQAARAALQSQDREDAERYRLLRRGQKWSVIDGIGNDLRAEELDTAIDHARRVEEKK